MGDTYNEWIHKLQLCIEETVSMRHPQPLQQIAHFLMDADLPLRLAMSNAEYVAHHGLAQRINDALDAAGLRPNQPQPPDALERLSAKLLQAEPAAAVARGPGKEAENQRLKGAVAMRIDSSEIAALKAEIAVLRTDNAALRAELASARTQPANGGPASAPGKSLAQAVTMWQQAQPKSIAHDSKELNAKFTASGNTFTFTYGDVTMFFAGLEGLLGSPSPEVMPTMMLEHASEMPFKAWNSDVERTTTPKAEWEYVTEGTAGTVDTTRGTREHAGWKLENFAQQPQIKQAGLLLAEVAGVRSYTGPMYVHYNRTLRKRTKGAYVTTLHAINSGIIKLSKQTKACTVYRGVAGGVLPEQFWTPNEHGVMGGIELGFARCSGARTPDWQVGASSATHSVPMSGQMSTSTERDVALMYMKQSGKAAKMVFEIRMGMIDRGADVSLLSQFPGEKEILFAPLTGLEVASVPRVEGDVIVVELRLSCNLHDLTMEEVIGKMQTGHKAMVQNMIDDFKQCSPPPKVLEPLQAVLDDSAMRGHEFFNVPELFRQATDEVLAAQKAAFIAVADQATWQAVTGSADQVAAQMRGAAKLCAWHDLHEEAARLLTMAVQRCHVAAEDAAAVEKACQRWRYSPTAEQRATLEAARLLMMSGRCSRLPWPLTLRALAEAGGHNMAANSLAVYSGLPVSVVRSRPFNEDATPKAVKGSALLAAAAAGNGEGVAAALAAGADANYAAENDVTAIMFAARAGSVSAVRVLLANGADAKQRSRKGCTALGLAAEAGAAECAKLLIDRGAEVDTAELETRITPLLEAARGGQLAVVEVLLANGAQIDLANNNGATPLNCAASFGYEAVAKALLAKGAQVDLAGKDGSTPLYWAANNGHETVVSVLLTSGAQVNLAQNEGNTPLVQAADEGHEAVVVALLAKGAQVDKINDLGATALSNAADRGHEAVVAALLANGAQVDLPSNDGRTPLWKAADEGHEAVVATLLSKGAKVDKANEEGVTPLAIAQQKRHASKRHASIVAMMTGRF